MGLSALMDSRGRFFVCSAQGGNTFGILPAGRSRTLVCALDPSVFAANHYFLRNSAYPTSACFYMVEGTNLCLSSLTLASQEGCFKCPTVWVLPAFSFCLPCCCRLWPWLKNRRPSLPVTQNLQLSINRLAKPMPRRRQMLPKTYSRPLPRPSPTTVPIADRLFSTLVFSLGSHTGAPCANMLAFQSRCRSAAFFMCQNYQSGCCVHNKKLAFPKTTTTPPPDQRSSYRCLPRFVLPRCSLH